MKQSEMTISKARQGKARQGKARQVIVLGGLGVSARRDRDPDRILHRHGIMYTLTAHIDKDRPLVVKRIES